jgi:hypothetical protein
MSTEVAERLRVATEKCPWCGSTISREKFEEIEERIAEEERRKLSEERSRMSEQLDISARKIREEANAKVAEMATERDLAVKEAAAQAEAKAKGELSTQLVALAEERDRVNAKLQEQEKANEKATAQRDLAVKEAATKAEAKAKEELGAQLSALAAERDRANTKLMEQEEAIKKASAERDLAIKDATAQAEVKAKAETSAQLSALTTERDQANTKLKEQEGARKKELDQQRIALEKDRDLQILKVQAEHNRKQEQSQKLIDALKRQVQHKTADDLGEGAEVDVYEGLREAFPRDDIKRVKRGAPGADIRQEVLYRGESCGIILIDSKNRNGWQTSYVTKLREDQMAAKAEHAILATTVFPRGKKEVYVDKETGIVVVSRARAVEISRLLRDAMIRMNSLRLSQTEKTTKREQLYKYISSEVFRQHLVEASRLSGEILDLDVEEKRAHEKIWQRRGKMATRMRNTVGQVETEISAIVEGRGSSREGAK